MPYKTKDLHEHAIFCRYCLYQFIHSASKYTTSNSHPPASPLICLEYHTHNLKLLSSHLSD